MVLVALGADAKSCPDGNGNASLLLDRDASVWPKGRSFRLVCQPYPSSLSGELALGVYRSLKACILGVMLLLTEQAVRYGRRKAEQQSSAALEY